MPGYAWPEPVAYTHLDVYKRQRAGDLADRGCVTGASTRNWAACGDSVELDSKRFGNSERALLTDPQTSGGLLISCAPEVVTQVLAVFLQQSFDHAAVIGEIVEGKPGIRFI